MKVEELWQSKRKNFLIQAEKAENMQNLLSRYSMLMEEMRMQTISEYPYDENLRQMIILLFQSAIQGAEFSLVQGEPVLVDRADSAQKAKLEPDTHRLGFFNREPLGKRIISFLKMLLAGPIPTILLLTVGVIYCLAHWPTLPYCVLIMAGAIVATLCSTLLFRKKDTETVRPTIKTTFRTGRLDSFITSQSRLLDQQIADLKLLLQDIQNPEVESNVDTDALKLCQQVWGVSNNTYPIESAYFTAEKLLLNSGAEWAAYSQQTRSMYDVMSTKLNSRTIFPAICSRQDGTVLAKGQYVEKNA